MVTGSLAGPDALDQHDHVRHNTSPAVNRRIDEEMAASVRRYARLSRDAVDARIEEVEREWDVERYLETTASTFAFIGAVMGLLGRRGPLLFAAVVAAFLWQHAVQGWCPPVVVFRALGARTRKEIEAERAALKALRGDYEGTQQGAPNERADAAVRGARA
jgi:predicted nucleic acid-binding protein